MKGLMKAAYYDPNPVVILEHKGLYWSKVKGTDAARSVLPDRDYVLPIGKAQMVLEASDSALENDNTLLIISYGMGVHWSLNAANEYPDRIGILDLRSIAPLDMDMIVTQSKKYHRILLVTEEPSYNGFAQSIAARVQDQCFEYLDAPVRVIGSANVPAIPLNETLEHTMIPNADKVSTAIDDLLSY